MQGCWGEMRDPTSRRLMESILAVEEGHADEMADLPSPHSGG